MSVPLFDAHCDTISRCARLTSAHFSGTGGQWDLDRMGECSPAAQFFAIFWDSARHPGESAQLFQDQYQVFRRELEQYGADVRFLKGGDEVCGHAMIQVDSRGQNCILIFHGSNYNIDEAYVDSVLDQFESGDMVVLQNEINTTHYIIEEAYKRGMKIALNPSPYDETIHRMPLEKLSWLVLNEVEVKDLSGQDTEEAYVRWFRERFPDLRVVVTLGRRGAMYIDRDQVIRHPAYNTTIVDTTTLLVYFNIARILLKI